MSAVVELSHLSKNYGGLRPLRIDRFVLSHAEQAAILGVDRFAGETLINLITGATLPDAGEVRVFGRPTSDITDSADWLGVVDRFGILTERAVLLDSLTAIQNLAMPFSLEIEPLAVDSPLLEFNNVLLAGHLAGLDQESHVDSFAMAARTIIALRDGEWPAFCIQNLRGVKDWSWQR